jgi:hypothetical protein
MDHATLRVGHARMAGKIAANAAQLNGSMPVARSNSRNGPRGAATLTLAPLNTYGPRIAQVPCRGAMLGTISKSRSDLEMVGATGIEPVTPPV